MTVLFDRTCEVTINTIKLVGHDLTFEIVKTLKATPNTCVLKIYNLSEEQRASLEEVNGTSGKFGKKDKKAGISGAKKKVDRGIPVRIEAGYGGENSLLWLGDLRTVYSVYQKPDWVTTLESGDAEKVYKNARINVTYGPKTSIDTALRAMVRALGVGEGNLSKIVSRLKIAGAGALYPHGAVISGPVARQLTDFTRSADLEWSIQDGAIQILDRGKALAGKAINLTPDTGLIGSPTVDNNGIISAQMLMVPDVRVGGLLVVDSSRVQGSYRIIKATWSGDTSGGDWYITVEGKRY